MNAKKKIEIFDKRIVLRPSTVISDMLKLARDQIDKGMEISIDTTENNRVILHTALLLDNESQ